MSKQQQEMDARDFPQAEQTNLSEYSTLKPSDDLSDGSRQRKEGDHEIDPLKIRGFIDSFKDNVITGWCADDAPLGSSSETALIAYAYVDDELVASNAANLERQDVVDAGVTALNCGFRFDLADVLKARSRPKRIIVKIARGFDGVMAMLSAIDVSAVEGVVYHHDDNDLVDARDTDHPSSKNVGLGPISQNSSGNVESISNTEKNNEGGIERRAFAVEPKLEQNSIALGIAPSSAAEESEMRPVAKVVDESSQTLPHSESARVAFSSDRRQPLALDNSVTIANDLVKRGSSLEAYIDSFESAVISGWAIYRDDPSAPVIIEVRHRSEVAGIDAALLERKDVEKERLVHAFCGFAVDVSKYFNARCQQEPIEFELFAAGETIERIGSVKIDVTRSFNLAFVGSMTRRNAIVRILTRIIRDAKVDRLERDKDMPFFEENNSRSTLMNKKYDGMFLPSTIPSTRKSMAGIEARSLSGYADYVRHRYKVDASFNIGLSHDERDRYLRWYIEVYLGLRAWRRSPIPALELSYLSEPGSIKGANRVMCFFLEDWRKSTRPIHDEERPSIAYWWAVELAPTLYIEDCLIPQWCIDSLAYISDQWKQLRFPLSVFMEIYFSRATELHFLDMSNSLHDRIILYVYFIVKAARRPDLLRYLPRESLAYLFSPESSNTQEQPLVEVVLGGLGIKASIFSLGWLRNMCMSLMFDLDRVAYDTITTDGDRVASAAMPLPHDNTIVDVQIIGPFSKASGLGQAARLSANMVSDAGFSSNAFDLGIDNPAPEGFSTSFQNNTLLRGRVNLIHLNAESVPLAFAYMPPIFSDAYNIGYFYWELDTPAACHFLALELLDEIWVSSEYCRNIYASHTSKPVINVGMCAEAMADTSRKTARGYLESRFGYKQSDFVFLAAFDSFSFVQRKNPVAVARAFRAAFPDDPTKQLMLKTHNRLRVSDPQQARIWRAVDEEAMADPRIRIVNETLHYDDLRRLKAGVDCYVSLHKSEGWGFGLIESMASGTPVIATGYSGNTDFCRADSSWLVDYDEVFLGPDDYIFVVPGQKWAEPRMESAVRQMRAVAGDPIERARRARRAQDIIRTEFGAKAIGDRYARRLAEVLAHQGC